MVPSWQAYGVYAVNVANAGRIDEIAAWIRARPGVRDAFVEVVLDVISVRDGYAKALERLTVGGPAPARLALAGRN